MAGFGKKILWLVYISPDPEIKWWWKEIIKKMCEYIEENEWTSYSKCPRGASECDCDSVWCTLV